MRMTNSQFPICTVCTTEDTMREGQGRQAREGQEVNDGGTAAGSDKHEEKKILFLSCKFLSQISISLGFFDF